MNRKMHEYELTIVESSELNMSEDEDDEDVEPLDIPFQCCDYIFYSVVE